MDERSDIACPFCGESGLDTIGLAYHLEPPHCDGYERARQGMRDDRERDMAAARLRAAERTGGRE